MNFPIGFATNFLKIIWSAPTNFELSGKMEKSKYLLTKIFGNCSNVQLCWIVHRFQLFDFSQGQSIGVSSLKLDNDQFE